MTLPLMSRRARNGLAAAGVLGLLALTACGGDANESAEASADDVQANGSTLVVYTNSDSHTNAEGQQSADWLTERAAEEGFEIEVVGIGGGDLTNRLIAEAGNPVADVVFGLNHVFFSQLVAAEAIAPYTPEWAQDVSDPALGDPSGEGYFHPIVQQGIPLVYNLDAVSPEEAPSDWTDLWSDEQWHGRYESVIDLGGATTQMVFSGILTRYQDPEGELGISDEGWEQVELYFEHGNSAVPETDAWVRLADREVDMAQQPGTSSIFNREDQYGIEVGMMEPEIGIPFAVEQVAVVNGTDQEDQAQEFVDWFGSAEIQAEWSENFGSMPAIQGAIDQADEQIVELHENLQIQDIDWEFVAENLPAWIEKIELEYIP
ncbi:extracellular solute-binding protein [Nesterenkonia massiliensis]|uniref:extracellular solute-binding protein n=1 Tax=Nesterenkonia massiliensis TaxID=1232429 RepID=UPI001F29632B|nr:extracellular solute-binding protein [Nesterenkonia massiliensis]